MEIAIWAVVIGIGGLLLFGWFLFAKEHPFLALLLSLLMLGE